MTGLLEGMPLPGGPRRKPGSVSLANMPLPNDPDVIAEREGTLDERQDEHDFEVTDTLMAGARDVGQRKMLGVAASETARAARLDERRAESETVAAPEDGPYNPFAGGQERVNRRTRRQRESQAATAREGASDALATAQRLEEANKKYIPSPVAEAALGAESLSEMFDAIGVDPIGFVAEIGIRSIPQMVEMIVLSAAGGAAGAGLKGVSALGGLGSATAAYGADILNEIKMEAGGDLTNEEAVMEALTNPELMERIKVQAAKYAAPIGAVDAVSMGLASKTLFGGVMAKKFGTIAGAATRIGEQGVMQPSMGALGEALGTAAAGREQNPVDLVAEAAGEFVGAPIESAQAYTATRRDKRRGEVQEAAEAKGEKIKEAVRKMVSDSDRELDELAGVETAEPETTEPEAAEDPDARFRRPESAPEIDPDERFKRPPPPANETEDERFTRVSKELSSFSDQDGYLDSLFEAITPEEVERELKREEPDYLGRMFDEITGESSATADVQPERAIPDGDVNAPTPTPPINEEIRNNEKSNDDGNRPSRDGSESRQARNSNRRQQEESTVPGVEQRSEPTRSDEGQNVAEGSRADQSVGQERRPESRSRREVRRIERDSERADKLTARVAEKSKGRILAVSDIDDARVPAELRKRIEERAGRENVPALFHDGKIYLFNSLIPDRRTARALVAHESVHAGLLELFGTEENIEQGIITLFGDTEQTQALLKRVAARSGMDVKAYQEAYSGEAPQFQLSLLLEEAAAHLRQSEVENQGAIRQLFDKIREILNTLGIRLPTLRDDKDQAALIKLVRDAERAFNRSKRQPSARGMSADQHMATRYSLKDPDQQVEWFSTLHEAAINLKQKKGKPKQMMAALRKTQGVKEEEILWTGVEDWLNSIDGSVTKDEIADYLFNNGVQIETHIAQGESRGEDENDLDWYSETVDDDSGNWEGRVEDYMDEFDNGTYEDHVMDMDDAVEEYYDNYPHKLLDFRMEVERSVDAEELAEFEQAVEDEDVREAISTITNNTSIDLKDEIASEVRDDYERLANEQAEREYMDNPYYTIDEPNEGYSLYGNDDIGWRVTQHGEHVADEIYDQYDAQRAAEEHRRENADPSEGDTKWSEYVEEGYHDNYQELKLVLPAIEEEFVESAHFDDPNIVAFARTSERKTIVDGEDGPLGKGVTVPMYFIEEMQSDWHQQGRRYGYGTPENIAQARKDARRGEAMAQRIGPIATVLENAGNNPLLMQWTRRSPTASLLYPNASIDIRQTELRAHWMRGVSSFKTRGTNPLVAKSHFEQLQSLVDEHGTREMQTTMARLSRFIERYNRLAGSDLKINDFVPNAPYQKDTWIELGFKRSLLDAVQNGFEHIGWPSGDNMARRWSDSYRTLYETQYDKKMPSLAKKLTGNKPTLDEAGWWNVKIDPEKASVIRQKGISKFAIRRKPHPLMNLERQTRENFERSGARGFADNINRAIGDKYEVLSRIQDAIAKRGGRVDEETDAHSAEKRMSGRIMGDLEQIEVEYVRELADRIMKNDITYDELDMFVYARHAGERNAYMREEFGERTTANPSGMSDGEAEALLNYFEAEGKTEALAHAADILYSMTGRMLDKSVEAGLMHEGIAAEYQKRYEFFVPLKGFGDTINTMSGEIRKPEISRVPIAGPGINISGKEFKRALGRATKASSPIANMIVDLTEKTIRAGYNEVGNHFLKFAQANPDKDQWEIYTDKRPDTAREFYKFKDPVTGEQRHGTRMRKMSQMEMRQNYFTTKYRGNQFYIKIKDPRLQRALVGMGPEKSNIVLRAMRHFNRYLSMLHTGLNPNFAATNILRDFQTGMIKLLAEETKDDGQVRGLQIAKDVAKDVFPAMRAMNRLLYNKDPRDDPDAVGGKNEMDMYAIEFKKAGGMTGYFDSKSVEETERAIQRSMWLQTTKGFRQADKVLSTTGTIVSNANSAVENAMRLSAYTHARKNGISKEKAANLAKDLTVNFNARGEHSNTLGALYLFANPTVQGIRNITRAMYGLNGDGSLKWENLNLGQKVAISAIAGSIAWAHMMRLAMGKDDDGEDRWDKIADYDRERAYIIPKFWTENPNDYMPIPAPYGYNVFKVIGESMEDALTNGTKGVTRGTKRMIGAFLGSFSPIGMAGSESVGGAIVKTVAPTAMVPGIELMMNENFFGSTIYDPGSPFGVQDPDASTGRPSTSENYKIIAQALNELGGGSEFIKGDRLGGALDVHPETLKYWVRYLTGGAGVFLVDQVINNSIDAIRGEPYDINSMPILGRFNNEIKPYDDQREFYERRNFIGQVINDRDDAMARDDTSRLQTLKKKYGNIDTLSGVLKRTQKVLSALRAERRDIYAKGLPYDVRYRELTRVEDEMKAATDAFNLTYDQALEQNDGEAQARPGRPTRPARPERSARPERL